MLRSIRLYCFAGAVFGCTLNAAASVTENTCEALKPILVSAAQEYGEVDVMKDGVAWGRTPIWVHIDSERNGVTVSRYDDSTQSMVSLHTWVYDAERVSYPRVVRSDQFVVVCALEDSEQKSLMCWVLDAKWRMLTPPSQPLVATVPAGERVVRWHLVSLDQGDFLLVYQHAYPHAIDMPIVLTAGHADPPRLGKSINLEKGLGLSQGLDSGRLGGGDALYLKGELFVVWEEKVSSLHEFRYVVCMRLLGLDLTTHSDPFCVDVDDSELLGPLLLLSYCEPSLVLTMGWIGSTSHEVQLSEHQLPDWIKSKLGEIPDIRPVPFVLHRCSALRTPRKVR
jgi:hypothetical protein